MVGESILELHETNATDGSIKSYECDEYQPITSTQLNSDGQIKITMENQDQFLHLHNSYLLVEGDVLKGDNSRYADVILITITNNELLSVFQFEINISWTDGGTCQLSKPGYITSRFGELFINIYNGMWAGTRLVSRHHHYCNCY